MAVSSSDIKLRVAIESASPDLSGVKQAGQEIVGMGQSAESAVQKVSVEAGTLADKLSKINSGGGLKELVADSNPAINSIAGISAELQRVNQQIEKLPVGSSQFQAYASASNHWRSELDLARQSVDRMPASINSVAAGFGRSNQVIQDMGRIISDMPYGIMGIGNNIQPLVESWSRAKAEVGGNGAAIRSVLQGLVGPAGLAMVGIPVVTSLAIAFGDKLVGAITAGGEKIDDFKDRVSGISQYKDFTIEIKIAGMNKLDALDRKLDVIGTKLKMVKEEEELEKRKAALPSGAISFVQDAALMIGAAMKAQYSTTANLSSSAMSAGTIERDKITKDDKARWQQYGRALVAGYNTAETGKGDAHLINYGEARNILALKSLGYTDRQIVIFNEHLAILGEKAGNAKDKTTELTRENKELAKSAKALEAQAEKYADAVKRADAALAKTGAHTLPTINDATKAVAVNDAEVKRLKGLNDGSVEGIKKLNDATTDLSASQSVLTKTTEEWNGIQRKVESALAKEADTTLSYSSALEQESKAEKALLSAYALGDGNREEITKREIELGVAHKVTAKAAEKATKSSKMMAEAFRDIGTIASQFGLNGAGVSGVMTGVNNLSDANIAAISKNQNISADAARNQVYAGIAQSIGQVVGGKTGSAISGAASGAAAGAMIAGPYGAVAGGILGLAGSLTGSNASEKQARQDARKSGYNSILSSALSGGEYSSMLARGGGYTYNSMAAWNTTVNGRSGQLLNDRGEAGMEGLTKYVAVMDDSLKSIATFARPSIITTINEIQTKYEYAIATAGHLAELEKARIDSLIVAVTGVSVDSLSTLYESIVTSTDPTEVGKAMADKVMDGLKASIRQMETATLMQSVVTPVLQPLLADLSTRMIAGSDITGSLSAIDSVMTQLMPSMNAFAQLLSSQNLVSSSAASAAAVNALSPVTIEARAAGGSVTAGQPYIVGEYRPELFVPSENGYIIPSIPSASSGSSATQQRSSLSGNDSAMFLREMKAILLESREVTVTIDGTEFTAWMESRRLRAETRIATGMDRLSRQVY